MQRIPFCASVFSFPGATQVPALALKWNRIMASWWFSGHWLTHRKPPKATEHTENCHCYRYAKDSAVCQFDVAPHTSGSCPHLQYVQSMNGFSL